MRSTLSTGFVSTQVVRERTINNAMEILTPAKLHVLLIASDATRASAAQALSLVPNLKVDECPSTHAAVFAMITNAYDAVVAPVDALIDEGHPSEQRITVEASITRLHRADPACAIIVAAEKTDQRLDDTLDPTQIEFETDLKDPPNRISRVLLRAAHRSAEQREIARGRSAARSGFEAAVGARTALVDSSGVIVAVNDAWRAFGGDVEPPYTSLAEGDSYIDACEDWKANGLRDADVISSGLRAVLHGDTAHFNYDYPLVVAGQTCWFTMDVNPLDSVSGGAVVAHVDITQRKNAAARAEFLALHDALTSLPNRVLFTDRLRHALSQRDRVPGTLAVLFVDLDHFKAINDRYGHGVGDAALQAIAERARATVRPGDTVARLSGDEFVILCEGVTEAEVDSIADRLVRSMAEPLSVDNQVVALSGSIGVAFATKRDETLDELMQRADKAMYQAKHDGRGRVVITAP